MAQKPSVTPLLPEPEVVHICIIDADPVFAEQLGILLATELPKMVNVVGLYDGIPERLAVPHLMSLVIFDPELDDFWDLRAAIPRMRRNFGLSATLAAHTDVWDRGDTPLKRELWSLGVNIGFRRFDLRRCIKLVTKIAMREPFEHWYREFI